MLAGVPFFFQLLPKCPRMLKVEAMEMNQLTFFLTLEISTPCGSTNCQAAAELGNQRDLCCYLVRRHLQTCCHSPSMDSTHFFFCHTAFSSKRSFGVNENGKLFRNHSGWFYCLSWHDCTKKKSTSDPDIFAYLQGYCVCGCFASVLVGQSSRGARSGDYDL